MVRKKIKQILKNRSRNNFKNYGRAVLLLLVAGLAAYFSFFFVLKVLASPPTSRYLIGETLEPSCAPGSDNCTIVSLAESGTNYDLTSLLGVSGSAKIGIGTSTATTFLDIYPKGSNKNLFYISSTSPGSILVAQKNGYVGIGTTSPGFLLSAGGDVNLKTGGTYRIGGIPVLTLASSSQWNSIGRNGSGLSLVNFADLHPVYTVGDSIMGEGSYQTQLRSLLGNSWDVINQAEAGEDTSMMLTEFQPNIIHRNDAEYIIIWGGINDAGNGVASTTAEANLQSMYTAAHNAGAKVVAINISPFKGASYWSDAHQKTATDINTWINTAAINIDYKIDSYTLLVSSTEPYTLWSKYDSGDHLHPNSTGLNRVASSTYWNVTWTPGVTIHSLRVAGDVYLNQSLRQSDSVGFNQISVNKIQSFWSSGFNGTATYYGPLTLNAGGGSVGMGTTYPNTSYGLDIEAGSSLNGLLIETYKTSGYAIITANSSNIGTYSSSSLTGIIGIGSKGIQGDTAVSTGIGIYGYNAATDGSGAIAVKGVDSSTSGGYGVLGVSNNWLGVQGWTANGYDFYSSLHKSRFEKTGLGNCYPVNQLDVNGGTAIGTYAGVSSAPANGLIVSGNVGIGTSTPAQLLQIGYAGKGEAGVTHDKYIYMPLGYTTSPSVVGDIAGIQFDVANFWTNQWGGNTILESYHGTQFIGSSANGSVSDPYFQVGHYQTTDLAIMLSGKIGIGTSSPASTLTVYGNASFGTYDSTAAPANGMIVSGSAGIATSSSSYTANIGGDLNIANSAVYRAGGVIVFTTASTTQWNGFKGGTLSGEQIETRTSSSTGTYTPTSGTRNAIVEIWAGGGGGGACNGTTAGSGGGGGSGGYALYYLTGVNGTYTFTIGQGGAAGSGGANAGGNGQNSTFVNGGTTITAYGGTGGTALSGSGAMKFMAGGAGGIVSTNGTINAAGAPGGMALTGNGTPAGAGRACSGYGGSTSLGGGGNSVVVSSAASTAGNSAIANTGSGGSGGSCGTGTQASGGRGAGGMIVIWEYK